MMWVRLAAEAVQSATLAFERVHDIHGGDSLSLGVFRVGDSVTDHILQEDLEHTARLLVDQTADALDSTTSCQSADSGLFFLKRFMSCHIHVVSFSGLRQTILSQNYQQSKGDAIIITVKKFKI